MRGKTTIRRNLIQFDLLCGVLAGVALTGCKPVIIGSGQTDADQTNGPVNQGTWDVSLPFPGAGIYAGVSNLPHSSSICSSVPFFGMTGTAACQSGVSSSVAGATQILAGLEAWGSSGTKLTGTLANRGALDAQVGLSGAGFYNGTVSNLPTGSQIAYGSTILGVAGSAVGTYTGSTASYALRNIGTTSSSPMLTSSISGQLLLEKERTDYAGADLPSSGSYRYRDIPNEIIDDEGTSGVNCNYAPRPSADCGSSQTSIAARMADCASKNPSASTWDGATQCNRGQATWKLVSRNGANKEVWQDQRTGLLWSSLVSTGINWCLASGSTMSQALKVSNSYNNTSGTQMIGNGTLGALSGGASSIAEQLTITFSNATTFTVTSSNGASVCKTGAVTAGGLTTTAGSSATWSKAGSCSFTLVQGSTNFAANDKFILDSISTNYTCAPGVSLQPASPRSFCAEAAGVNAPVGENWGTGVYSAAKGLMGKNSSPAVRWRLPTLEDYQQANIDGIRMVMPDMGITGARRPNPDGSTEGGLEWIATLSYFGLEFAWTFTSYDGLFNANGASYLKSEANRVRCIGR